jgi:EAL domain-containing protein (putative c-di-GMP-specific phosphodiesterase class I)
MPNQKLPRVLILDDESAITEIIASSLDFMNLPTKEKIHDPLQLHNLDLSHYDVMFLDLMMPNMDGIEVMRLLSEKAPQIQIVLMSGMDTNVLNTAKDLACESHLRVLGHLNKPFRPKQVIEIIQLYSEYSRSKADKTSIAAIPFSLGELRNALNNKKLQLFYQPQFDLKTLQLVGFEALCRLQIDNKIIYPDQFIQLAENNQLIHPLTQQVVQLAFQEFATLTSATHSGISLSLNISGHDLSDLEFPDYVSRLADKYNIPKQQINFEVTETQAVENMRFGLDVISRLRLKGFKISIDDYGTGYAMLDQIKRLPASELKIDRTFVKSISEKGKSVVLVRKILEMAQELNMEVVAEGIEDELTADWLQKMGCEIGQGYFFAKPMPLQQVSDFYRELLATA